MSVESKGFAGALSGGAPVRHSRISGIGGYRPKRVVPNAEIVDLIDSSDEWIRERSGIIERRFAGPDEGIIEMYESGEWYEIVSTALTRDLRDQ